jgi:threonine aldolase
MIDLPDGRDSATIVRAAADADVLVSAWSPTRVRAVTHRDADRAQVERAAEVLAAALAG